MTPSFALYCPVKVHFGEGAVSVLGRESASLGQKALLLTGGRSAEVSGTLSKVLDSFKQAGAAYSIFPGIKPDPKLDQVYEAARFCRREKCDVVIGLGGGSVMDAAKAVALAAASPIRLEDYLGGDREVPQAGFPVITVPTIAGSGSEVSKSAILTDVSRGIKSGIRGPALFPKAAVLDPVLTYAAPAGLTAQSSFDALCHGIETFISKKANPLVELYSQAIVSTLAEYLPRALSDGRDAQARLKLLWASFLGGCNLAHSTTCLPHRLQYPVGAVTGTSHAMGLVALTPYWAKRAFPCSENKFDIIAGWLPKKAKKILDNSKNFYRFFQAWPKELGLHCRLRDLGVKKGQLAQLTEKVLSSPGSLAYDPSYEGKKTVQELYLEAW